MLSIWSPILRWNYSVSMDCFKQTFVSASGQIRLDRFFGMDLQESTTQHQPGQKECQLMIPCGIVCHIMSQLFRRCMGLFYCYLQLMIKWRQSQVFPEQCNRKCRVRNTTGTHQIQHEEHKNNSL